MIRRASRGGARCDCKRVFGRRFKFVPPMIIRRVFPVTQSSNDRSKDNGFEKSQNKKLTALVGLFEITANSYQEISTSSG